MSNPNRSKLPAILSGIVFCFVIVMAGFFALSNKQLILDQISIWQYEPSSEVVGLIDQSGMNDYGKFLFLASQPTLAKSTSEVNLFNSVCREVELTTSILGCYSNHKIFLYNITDPQLDGIRETTAAHETLHAAYARMSAKEKLLIDNLLELESEKLKNDPEFIERMAYYARSQPGQRTNELHSIIGTEVASIDPELESYYKKYFADRQKVVALNARYSSVFRKIASRAKELSVELAALSESIKSSSDRYNSETQAVNAAIVAFNNNASNGLFTSQSQFDHQRAVLVSKVSILGQMRTNINNDIAKYDALVTEYNSIASQSEKLNNSLDSTLVPAPSV